MANPRTPNQNPDHNYYDLYGIVEAMSDEHGVRPLLRPSLARKEAIVPAIPHDRCAHMPRGDGSEPGPASQVVS